MITKTKKQVGNTGRNIYSPSLHLLSFDIEGGMLMLISKKIKNCQKELSRKEILQIIRKHLIRQVPHDFEIQDGIPQGCIIYNVSCDEPCWTVFICSEEQRTGPSRIICISKKSGKIIYDGRA